MKRRRRWRLPEAGPRRMRNRTGPGRPGAGHANDVIEAAGVAPPPLVNWRRRRRRPARQPSALNRDRRALINELRRQRSACFGSDTSPRPFKNVSRRAPSRQQLRAIALLCCSLALVACSAPPAAGQQIVSDDHESVIIRGHQGHLFRGARLARAPEDGLGAPSADVVAFLGVRYASAPVKRLRFMPPTPFNYAKQTAASNQSQVHDMRQFGPVCPQHLPMQPTREQAQLSADERAASRPADWRAHRAELQAGLMERLLAPRLLRAWRPTVERLTSRFVQSEDCLNLNIYTPIEALERGATDAPTEGPPEPQRDGGRPVLVVFHGHSFDFGSGSALEGRRFARNNRVVVITLNYRLHILGFPVRAASASRTNLGLLDQVAALHWIQANVRSFGGSPAKITLMGAEGGAIFVHLLMLSPLAKGLFQRAVLEDGTALSPVIANNMALAQQGARAHHPHQPVATAGQQAHLQLLAQLDDCPANLSSPAALNGQGGDEQRLAVSAAVECLRQSSAEAITRNLPLELVDFGRPVSRASIPLAARWLGPLEQTLDLLIKEELVSQIDAGNSTSAGGEGPHRTSSGRRERLERLKRVLSAAREEQVPASVESRQLDELIGQMISRFLKPEDEGQDGAKLDGLLSDLLGAIYLPSNKTLPMGPMFAPQLEPGLVLTSNQATEEMDLAGAMLHRNSPFNRRDLLIGLTHPLANFNTGTAAHHVSEAGLSLAPSSLSRKFLEFGLSEEQAIGQVNLFVRSFYRYHQQEISNSIISQYLSRKGGSPRPSSLALPAGQDLPAGADQQAASARLQKQLFLADALRALYQDSLVDVPLMKSALIHSLQQLESLADLFVGEQLSRLERSKELDTHQDDELEQLISDERQLEEAFLKYAKKLYQKVDLWPVRLARPSGRGAAVSRELLEQSQPRSTFVFQFDNKFDWSPRLRASLGRPGPHHQANGAVRAIIGKMIEELAGSSERTRSEPVCSFAGAFDQEERDAQDVTLFASFKTWICRRRVDRRLANFVETGNVNVGGAREPDRRETLRRRFDDECSSQGEQAKQQHQDLQNEHEHLVRLQAGDASAPSDANIEEAEPRPAGWLCGRLLQELAFEEIAASGADEPGEWSLFNVFTQRLASLFSAGESDCSMSSFVSSPDADSQLRELFEEKVSFWANFVTALNCSKTQPIGAGSLSLFSQANSTLLNMNLNLNCQQAGARTANSILQSMGGRIKQELARQLDAWQRSAAKHKARSQLAANLSLNQNHHSLRMANMSSTQEQQHQTTQLESGAELGAASQSSSGGLLWLAEAPATRARLFLQQLTPAALLLLCATLGAVLSLAAGGVVMLRRRRRRERKRQKPKPEAANDSQDEQPDWNVNGFQVGAGLFDASRALEMDQMAVIGDQTEQPTSSSFLDYAATTTMPAGGLQPETHKQSPPSSRNIVSPSNQLGREAVELAISQLGRLSAQPEMNFSDPNGRSSNSSSMNVAAVAPEQHLPSCNLMLLQQQQQHHQQQQLISSSSETTTTTNTQRAQSSVSLVSADSRRPLNKKRVKISDPRRRAVADIDRAPFELEPAALVELDARRLRLVDSAELSPQQFCPIHRSSSNLNLLQSSDGQQLVVDDATKYQLLSGHQSLLRNGHGDRHQQRALVLNDNYLDGVYAVQQQQQRNQSAQQVCAAHNFEHQQQMALARGFYQNQPANHYNAFGGAPN